MNEKLEEIFISYAEHQKLIAKLDALSLAKDEQTSIKKMEQYKSVLKSSLSSRILDKITELNQSHDTIGLVIRGLPYDFLFPSTPYSTQEISELFMPTTAAIILGIYNLLGLHPVTYFGENNGNLFRHVAPTKNAIKNKTSQGSYYPLGMHVDNCYLPLIPEEKRKNYSICPEFLSLFGLRCDLKAVTKIAIVDEVLLHLSENSTNQLMKADYIVKNPDSFSHSIEFEVPLLFIKNGISYLRFDEDFVKAKNQKAKAALDEFSQALYRHAVRDVILQPGDFLIFKNQRTLHGRSGFSPRFDGRDRWLVRLFGVRNLANVYSIDKSKPYHIAA